MAKLPVKDIRDLARSIVSDNPGGIRYGALVKQLHQRTPETSTKTIRASTWNLDTIFPSEISKPSRGLYAPAGNSSNEAVVIGNAELLAPTGATIRESDFYAPFADWLKDDLGEVNEVIPLGGAGLKSKWGTPDVVGTYKPLARNLVKFPIEIVVAEIKIDPQAPVVAFGQAVAYRLFATKTYIVMPTSLAEKDKGRLEALCMLFGVGLVLFNTNKDDPDFSIRMRAQRFSPDMFYVNEFAESLKSHNAEVFEKLFS